MVLQIIIKKHSSVLWYPACGTDLRICHHIVANNSYLNPSLIIANDTVEYEAGLSQELKRVRHVTVINEQELFLPEFNSGSIVKREFRFQQNGFSIQKTVIHLWRIKNQSLLDYFFYSNSTINAIFCKRMRGDNVLETDLSNSLNTLRCRHFISDLNHLRDGEYDCLRAVEFARKHRLILKLHCSYYRTKGYNPEYVFLFENRLAM